LLRAPVADKEEGELLEITEEEIKIEGDEEMEV
jgi:hypothetical protein